VQKWQFFKKLKNNLAEILLVLKVEMREETQRNLTPA
jgi:hypothetical protein